MRIPSFSHVLTFLLLVFFFASTGPVDVLAQETPTTTTPNVKEYGRPGYPEMTVYVWGDADTGVWNVEEGTDLLEFLSVVSRLRFGENRPDQRAVQTLRLYRDGRVEGSPVFESRVQELFTEREEYPDLQEGDILVLETRSRNRFTWRDVREVVGTAAVLLNTYLLIDRLRTE